MSICLYKKGNTHIVRGVTCEMRLFDVGELDFALNSGYVQKPEDTIESPAQDITKDQRTALNKKIRLQAKSAGISGYDTKMIATLKNELGHEN